MVERQMGGFRGRLIRKEYEKFWKDGELYGPSTSWVMGIDQK